MRKCLLTILIVIALLPSHAQRLLDSTIYFNMLQRAKDTAVAQIRDSNRLVSEYTFRSLVRNDYALVLTGDKNKTTVGRYASLEIKEDEHEVSLTPFAFVPGNKPLDAPFHWIHSVDLSASLNSKNIFDFSDRKKISAGYSVTYASGAYKFRLREQCFTADCKYKPDTSVYNRLYQSVYQDFINKYTGRRNIKDTLDLVEYAEDSTELAKAYYEKVKDYETKLTAEIWNKKKIWWLKLNIIPLSWDVMEIINLKDAITFTNPQNESVYNPSVQLSYNRYATYRKAGTFYWNAWLKGSIKHTLSEIGSTSEWSKISSLGDSSFYTNDSKDVYVLHSTQIEKKLLPDFGGQFIYVLPSIKKLGNLTFGIDLSASWKGILSPTANDKKGYVQVSTIGIILPLKDKEGEASINIEPFYERKSYRDYDKDAKEMYGVKFSLPFKTLIK